MDIIFERDPDTPNSREPAYETMRVLEQSYRWAKIERMQPQLAALALGSNWNGKAWNINP